MMQASDIVGIVRDLLLPARRLGTLTLAAVAAVALLLVMSAWPILGALRAAPGKAPTPVADEVLDKSADEFNKMLASSADRINARAPFGAVRVAAKPEPKAAVATRYGGPALVGMAADEAWFAEGKRIKVGATEFGISVLALDPPWGAKVLWGGGEFIVSLFDRAPISMSQPLSVWQGAPPPPPPPAPPKPAVPAPVAAAGAVAGPGQPPAPGQAAPPGPGGPNGPPTAPANVQPFPQGRPIAPPPGPGDNAPPLQNAPPPPPQPEPEQRTGTSP